MTLLRKLLLISLAAFLFSLPACDNNPAANDPTGGQIKISIKSVTGTTQGALGKIMSAVTITSAQVVIEEIEFESSYEDTMDFKLAEPFVQDLLSGSNLHEITTVEVPFGTYKEMEIKIDKLDEEKSAAYAQNPELRNLSIRVEGYLNNERSSAFVFESDLSQEQEQEFNPSLVLDETNPATNLVLTLDMASWFVDSNNQPLDPNLAENKSRIESNIKSSFTVFEDEDDDGEEDGHDED